jgi:predicted ATPase/class 3 adenylate cyclase
MPELPTGTVTFLFTDIEGSTTRWEQHPEAMRTALARHDALLRETITAHDGVVAALAAQLAVLAEQWGEVGPLRVRMALHSGVAQCRESDYFGPTLNRIARLLSTGYGGQILLSAATQELARDALPPGVSLQDLGEHVLKDLLRPEHVFQLVSPDLEGEFPPLKSLERRLHNLPVQPTPLIGREQEVASVCGLLRHPEVRLVTLTGPAGVGKTRLGLQVAAELVDQFADGVFAAFLAPVSEPDLVISALTQTLGVVDTGTQPPLTLLKGALKDRHLLLVLDNFEQVVEAAVMVADLLTACPRLKVLVTSRVVLHVRAEREFVVPPLSLPNLKRLPELVALSQYEAVALFIERALAVKPDFAVTNTNAPAVAGICARLDGLPLAIELAAARVKYFPLQTLLARLEQGLAVLTGGARDLPARQQTMRGAFAWSYELLTPEEQALFRRLAVFVDGCTVEAAEQVCTAAGTLGEDILEGLVSLVDKSLLRQEEQAEGEARFWILQVLREFGLEALANTGEMEATRQAHALYYLALAEKVEPELAGPQQALWLERLELEYDNLRAALWWCLERGGMGQNSEMALRLAGALRRFWEVRSHWSEGRNFLEQALAGSKGIATPVHLKALKAAAHVAFVQSDTDRAEALYEECLARCRELGDTAGIALSLRLLGAIAGRRGNLVVASSFKEESLALFRALGNIEGIIFSLLGLAGTLFLSQDDPAKVRALLEEGLALCREVGYKEGIAWVLSLLGEVFLQQGDTVKARSLLEESVALIREIVNRNIGWLLFVLGRVAESLGDYAAARALYEESLAKGKEVGDKLNIAFYLEGLADVVALQGEPAWAAQLWGSTEALREAMGTPIPPVYHADYERAVAAARVKLGEEAFAAAWAEGRTTPVEQVIDEALKPHQIL